MSPAMDIIIMSTRILIQVQYAVPKHKNPLLLHFIVFVTGKTNKPSLHDMVILSSIGSTQLFCACQDRSSLSPELLLQQLGPAFAKKFFQISGDDICC
jgi:hypothetical protein